jgi:hypothetical protein
VNRMVGLAALVALAVVGLYAAFRHAAPAEVLPGIPERPVVSRAGPTKDAGLDDLLDATKIQHALGR